MSRASSAAHEAARRVAGAGKCTCVSARSTAKGMRPVRSKGARGECARSLKEAKASGEMQLIGWRGRVVTHPAAGHGRPWQPKASSPAGRASPQRKKTLCAHCVRV